MDKESEFIKQLNRNCEDIHNRSTRKHFRELIGLHEKIYKNLNDSYRLHLEIKNKKDGLLSYGFITNIIV